MFSKAEQLRYSRHMMINDFGEEAQAKLKTARLLAVGAGGLGSPVLLYLAAAGVGHIGIVDHDVVEDSNLQRQVLYSVNEIGRSKAEAARARLLELNPYIEIKTYTEALNSSNALDIMSGYDIVVDGTDNFPTRYLVNDACVLSGKPNIYASIFQFEGQVSVFNYLQEDGERGPNYRDIYPEPPEAGLVPNCAEAGVLGVLPGIIGSMQALEAIKVITGVGEPLSGKLMTFDALDFDTRVFNIQKNPANPLSGDNPTITELIDYEQFCGVKPIDLNMKNVSPSELHELQQQNVDFQLIDVREPDEYENANLGGELIPLNQVASQVEKISKDKQVVVMCRSGKRSANAIQLLEEQYGFTNLYNLEGGILNYISEMDLDMDVD